LAMSSREERVARNEAVSRDINERIEDAQEEEAPGQFLRIVCECGRDDCERVIAITRREYEEVRSDPVRFAVAHDHVTPDLEREIDRTDRFAVVVKREGTPAEVATEEDPRS
jgi:hypothetical protein